MKFDVPALMRAKSMQGAVSSIKAVISAKYFREGSLSADGAEGFLNLKDLEADNEFEMLALDG